MYPIIAILLPPFVPLLKAKLLYFLVNTILYAFAWLTLFIFPPVGVLLYVVCVVHAFTILSQEKQEALLRAVRYNR